MRRRNIFSAALAFLMTLSMGLSVSAPASAAEPICEANPGENGYMSLHEYISPTDDPTIFRVNHIIKAELQPKPKKVVFVLDASGSMWSASASNQMPLTPGNPTTKKRWGAMMEDAFPAAIEQMWGPNVNPKIREAIEITLVFFNSGAPKLDSVHYTNGFFDYKVTNPDWVSSAVVAPSDPKDSVSGFDGLNVIAASEAALGTTNATTHLSSGLKVAYDKLLPYKDTHELFVFALTDGEDDYPGMPDNWASLIKAPKNTMIEFGDNPHKSGAAGSASGYPSNGSKPALGAQFWGQALNPPTAPTPPIVDVMEGVTQVFDDIKSYPLADGTSTDANGGFLNGGNTKYAYELAGSTDGRYSSPTTVDAAVAAFGDFGAAVAASLEEPKATIDLNVDAYDMIKYKDFPLIEARASDGTTQSASKAGNSIVWGFPGSMEFDTSYELIYYVQIKDGLTPGTYTQPTKSSKFEYGISEGGVTQSCSKSWNHQLIKVPGKVEPTPDPEASATPTPTPAPDGGIMPVFVVRKEAGLVTIESFDYEIGSNGTIKMQMKIKKAASSNLVYLWQMMDEDGEWQDIFGANGTVYNFRNYTKGKVYKFRLKMRDEAGNEFFSDEYEVDTRKVRESSVGSSTTEETLQS